MAAQRNKLGSLIADTRSALAADALMDSLVALGLECKAAHLRRLKNVERFSQRYEDAIGQIKDLRPKRSDFEMLKVIGRGAYGEVQLVRHKETHELFALKTLSKCEMLKKTDSAFYWEERDIMSHSNSPWIVQLHFAFQDDNHLYMAMDYMAGGDLVTLQEKMDFPEHWAKFYTAELVLALEDLHGMGYVHRDVKPDNVLLDARGHLKLADFGTCVRVDDDAMVNNPGAAVGTPDYISPEVLESQNGNGRYGVECDWWSVGVFLFELLFMDPPFYDDTLVGTYGKILGHEPDKLEFPPDVPVSDEAKDLLRKLLRPRETRIGANDITDLKAHPFFHGIDWANLRETDAPFIPNIGDSTDTSNFPEVEKSSQKPDVFTEDRSFSGNQLPFIGFTFHREGLGLAGPETQSAGAFMLTSDQEDVGVASLKAANDRLQETVGRLKQEVQSLTQQNKAETAAKAQALKEVANLKETIAANATKMTSEVEKKYAVAQLEMEELNAKLAKAEEARARVQTAMEETKETLAETKEENSTLSARIARLQADLTAANEQKNALLSQIGKSPRRSESIAVDSDSAALEQKLKAANRARQTLKSQIEELEMQLSTAERNARREKKKSAQLQDEVEELRGDLAAAKSETAAAVAKQRELEHQQDIIADAAQQKDSQLRELRKKCAQYEVDVQELRSTIDKEVALRAKLSSVESAPPVSPPSDDKTAKQLEKIKSDLKTSRASEATLLTQVEELEDEVVRLRGANTKLAASARLLEDQLADIDSTSLRALESQVSSLKSDNEALTSDVDDLKETLQQREKSLAAAKQQLHTAQETIANLEAEVARVQSTQFSFEDYEAEKTSAAAQLDTYKTENAELHEQVSSLTAKKETLEAKISSLEEGAAAAAAALDDANARADALESWKKRQAVEAEHERTAATQETARLQTKVDELSRQLDASTTSQEKQRELLRTRITELEEKNDELEHKLEQATAAITAQTTKITQLNNKVKEVENVKEIALKQREQALKGLELLNTGGHVAGASRDSERLLHKQLSKQRKLARSAQAEVEKLKAQLKASESDHRKRLVSVMEDHGKLIRGLQQQFQEDQDNKSATIEELQAKCAAKDTSLRALQAAVDEMKQDEGVKRFGSQRLKRTLSGLVIHNEGWVCMPGDRGIKKSGWRPLFAVLDIEGLKLYQDNEQSTRSGDPTLLIGLAQLVGVEPAQRSELIHANPADVPLVFKVRAARLEGQQGIGSDDTKKKGFVIPRSMSFALPTRQKSDGHESKKGGFWKGRAKNSSTSSSSSGGGDGAYREYFFKAESLGEQRAWVSRITVAIDKKGELFHAGKKSPTTDKASHLNVPGDGDAGNRSSSSPNLVRKPSSVSTASTTSRTSRLSQQSGKTSCV